MQALPRILAQASFEQRADRQRASRGQRVPIGFALQDADERVGHRVAVERRRPDSISKSTHPNAQMSVRLSTACPRACSGLM